MENTKILVVDDEQMILDSFKGILEDEGFAVNTAKSGKEALDFLKVNEVDLIISDIRMPNMDGIELLKRIKNMNKETQVIMITGNGDEHSAVDSLKAGAYDYLNKPVEIEKLLNSINNCLHTKKLRNQKKNMEKALFQSKKMEAIGTLAGGIAHDFNNIMMIILGNCDLAMEIGSDDNPLIKQINEINQAAQRAEKLTKQLLAYSRKQVFQKEVINLNNLIEDVSGILKRLIGQNINLKTELDHGLENVLGDARQIDQVLINLVINARDAITQGKDGNITIKTQNITVDKGEFEGVNPGIYSVIMVSDNGEGMGENTVNRIFEPFFTTKEVGKGTGLGLAMVYGIIKQSKAKIHVETTIGNGTNFRLFFYQVDIEIKEKEVIQNKNIIGNNETILVVEDDESLLKLTSSLLQRGHFNILKANSGEQALEIIDKHNEEIDLILTDVAMPGIGGIELSKRVLNIFPEMKIVFLSGHSDKVIIGKENENNFNFIPKPVTSKDLLAKMNEVLNN